MGLGNVEAPHRRVALGAAGAALFLLTLSALDALTRGALDVPALVPPFGASVAIVFFAPDSPMGRPWNVVGGHVVSALAASAVVWLMPHASATLLSAVAVPLAIMLMVATRSFHPPGGATALLAVMAQPKLGFGMVLCPVLVGALPLVTLRAGIDAALRRGLRKSQPPMLVASAEDGSTAAAG